MITILLLTLIQMPSSRSAQNPAGHRMEELSRLAHIVSACEKHSLLEPSRHFASDVINGMLQTLDPHSTYFDAMAFSELKAGQSGSFTGIGIRVITTQAHIFVSEVKANSPAFKAGLRWGDEIISVEQVNVSLQNMESLISRIRGKNNSTIALGIRSYPSGEKKNLNIIRSEIQNTCVGSALMLSSPNTTVPTGYIELTEFGETSGTELEFSLTHLLNKGCVSIILDLRNNPGGLLQQAIECANLFLPSNSIIVKTRGRYSNEIQSFKTSLKAPRFEGPLIILMNQGTASAAEILAGALQDHDRALILGSQSWGKGLVQSVFSLPPGETGLALTTARYTTPLGRNIQGDYRNLYDYLQPLSGEEFFFHEKTEDLPHVITPAGRLIYISRGIGPDIFFENKNMTLAEKILDYNQSLALFIMSKPERKSLPPHLFGKEFASFFTAHNGFSLAPLLSTGLKKALYLKYYAYTRTHIQMQKLTSDEIAQYDIVRLALRSYPQAKSLSSVCFEHKPLPDSLSQSMFQLSVQARSGQGDFN